MPRNLPYNRADRIAHQIFQITSSYIYERIDDERLARLQITNVRLTKDLSIARIYYYMEGGKTKLELATRALEEMKKELRHHIAQEIVLRSVPKIEFYVDEGFENAERINELLKGIKTET